MNNIGKLLVCGFLSASVLPALALDNTSMKKSAFVHETKVISAPLNTVWEAVKAQKINDPVNRHVLSTSGPVSVVEETFNHVPVLGTVTCQYTQHELPGNKLEYKMTNSNKFVAFEGEWKLTKLADGQTSVTLSSFVDSGLKLPFADKITRMSTKKSVTARLTEIEQWVDKDKKSHIAAK
jgi:hypothetical protein